MIFRDELKREIVYLLLTFIITVIIILGSELHINNTKKIFRDRIYNQESRKVISNNILMELTTLEKENYRLKLITDETELKNTKIGISDLYANIKDRLKVLEEGGKFRLEGNGVTIYYQPEDHMEKGECISILPELKAIKEISQQLVGLIKIGSSHNIKTESVVRSKLQELYLLINNCRQNINKINMEADKALYYLREKRNSELYYYKIFRSLIIFSILFFGFVNFKKTINKITEIIKERDLYTMNIKSMNKILMDKQNFIESVFNSVSVGIVVTDFSSKKIININNAAVKAFKTHYNNVIDTPYTKLFHEENLNPPNTESNNYYEFETGIRDLDGNYKTVLMSSIVTKLNDRLCRVINFIDISNLKDAERALRESEELNRAVIENSPIGISVRDRFGTLLKANNSWKKIWNIKPEKLIKDKKKREKLEFNARDSYLKIDLEKVRDVYENGGEYYIPEIGLDEKNGRETSWISHHFYAIQDEQGQVDKVVILTEDISKRKEAENALKERNIRYQTLIERANDAIFLEDRQGRIIDVNIQACKLTGFTKEELLQKNMSEIWAESPDKDLSGYKEFDVKNEFHKESEIIDKMGDKIAIEKTTASFEDKQRRAVLSIVRDITDRKRNELVQSVLFNIANAVNTTKDISELYRTIHKNLSYVIDTTNFYIALYDKEKDIVSAPYYIDKYKKTPPPDQKMGNGLTAYVIRNKKSLFLTAEKRKELISLKHIPEYNWRSKLWLGVPLINQNGDVIGAMAVQSYDDEFLYQETDLPILEFVSDQIAIAIERRKAENKIRESEEIIRAFMDSATDSMSIWSREGRLLEINTVSTKMLNTKLTAKELIGKNVINIIPQFKGSKLLRKCLRVIKTRIPYSEDYMAGLKGLGDRHFSLRAFKVNNNLGVIVSDITKRKEYEKRIEAALQEKEVMLKEIHHRVKNNMQVISSLLNLQSGYIVNKRDKELFKESQNRVKSMSLIHEKLYQSKNLASIDFREYVKNLTRHLYVTFGVNISKIRLYVDVNDIFLDVNSAIPCGLIINELVSNSLKYAFPDNREGKIFIEITQNNELIKMVVRDDGIGLPDNLNIEESDSLGLQLVNTLSMQLESKVTINSDAGASFTFEFTDVS